MRASDAALPGRDVRAERLDPRRARICGEPVDEQRADAAVLPVVHDRERHLGDSALPHEPRDPHRLACRRRRSARDGSRRRG